MSSKNPPFKDYRYQYQQNSSFRSPTEIKKSSKAKLIVPLFGYMPIFE